MNTKEHISWISWLRILGMIMIILCHMAAQSSLPIANVAGQFFNVGVEIFFLISGYLFGRRLITGKYSTWYRKRFLRLLPPYYLTLIILLAVHTLLHIHQGIVHWLVSLFCLQGIEIYLWGAEHLWFLTVLIFCYLITPVLDQIRKKNLSTTKIFVLYILSCLLQIICTLFIYIQLGRYLLLVNLYILAYIIGASDFRCDSLFKFGFAGCIGLTSLIFRLLGRHFLDGTIYYDVFIVGITHCGIALAIMMGTQYVMHRPVGKIASFLDQSSYEIYLVHYMFISGPVSLMHTTNFFLLNAVVATVISLICATVVHQLAQQVSRKLSF